ncbi:unnamed protein product [Chironomus riparius]|uniref:Uncharacterized protein n=1 Tax=Chironomus riparius TaxID=315576 RepID=A0A9N9RWT4_9DIPT|nr:unnamed protein product [Chironomus riparius]
MINKLFSILFVISTTLNLIEAFKKCIISDEDPSLCTIIGVRDPNEMYGLNLISSKVQNSKITKIKFNDSRIYHLPKELSLMFENLEDLDASNVYLSRFTSMDFPYRNKLRKLNVSNNAIHILPKRLTVKFDYLEVLDISYNLIDTIENESFTNKERLKYLNLSHNQIKVLNVDFLSAVRNVRSLNLGCNEISEINLDCQDIDFKVKELYLNDNKLMSIQTCLIKNVAYFDIGNNKLIGELGFLDSKIENLNIQGNSIESLNISRKVKVLDFSNNIGKSLKINFEEFSSLKTLKVSNLDVTDYKDLYPQLKMLNNLIILDISHNNLKTFNFMDIPESIECLNLEKSNLKFLENFDLLDIVVPNLNQININQNLFNCKELTKLVENFEKFNINVTGFTNENKDKFIRENCGNDENYDKKRTCNDGLLRETLKRYQT